VGSDAAKLGAANASHPSADRVPRPEPLLDARVDAATTASVVVVLMLAAAAEAGRLEGLGAGAAGDASAAGASAEAGAGPLAGRRWERRRSGRMSAIGLGVGYRPRRPSALSPSLVGARGTPA
jgi:hypothetical protein